MPELKYQRLVLSSPSAHYWILFPSQLVQQWHSLDEAGRSRYSRKSSRCPEPSLGLLRPDINFGSVSENFHDLTEKYLQSRDTVSQDRLDSNRYSMCSNGRKRSSRALRSISVRVKRCWFLCQMTCRTLVAAFLWPASLHSVHHVRRTNSNIWISNAASSVQTATLFDSHMQPCF